jgi:hypothetical protein
MAAQCPSCGAAVEDGADLCLECGEPMGDSPAAKLARAENVIRPPANAFAAPKPPPPVADHPGPAVGEKEVGDRRARAAALPRLRRKVTRRALPQLR